MITILNTSILTTFGSFEYEPLTLEQAQQWVSGNQVQSAIGHQSTVDVVNELLAAALHEPLAMNRIFFQQEPGQNALVFKLKGRPEEGKILSRDDIEKIGYEWGLLTRTA